MKQIELRLIPAPGQNPEFLATLELVQKTPVPSLWEQLPSVIVLEGYTRDAWAMDSATTWTHWQVESVDGRNKLPGFVKYLRDRQKTAYGRVGGNQLWVVSQKQMSSTALNCRIAKLEDIPQCPFRPTNSGGTGTNSAGADKKSNQPIPGTKIPSKPVTTTNTASTNSKPKKSGLLGNLVGAQRRTNQQVQIATAIAPKKAPSMNVSNNESTGNLAANNTSEQQHQQQHQQQQQSELVGTKTAGQVLADFRQEMEQEMLDFDLSSEPVLKLKIDLPAKLRLLTEEDKQSGRVTMEVLKYIVYEQAEEVNEEWIAHKEPSEFMDEVVISIYKEGEAPPEVLEDINKAELPDEVRGQQRAIVEQRQKAEQIKAQKLRMEQMKLALQNKAKSNQQDEDEDDDDDLAALNTQKRDRRTVEDYEREAKRRRGE